MWRIVRYPLALFIVLSLIVASVSPFVQTLAVPVPDLSLGSQPDQSASPDSAASGADGSNQPSSPSRPSRRARRPGRPPTNASATPTPGGDQVANASAPQPQTPDLLLQQQIQGYLDGQPGTYGVAVQDLATGRVTLLNADRTFESASTYKLLVLYCVYKQLSEGKLTLDKSITITDDDAVEDEPDSGLFPGATLSVGAALRAMVLISSNAAAHALARTVGGWDQVVSSAKGIGMGNTLRDPTNTFVTTPNDMLIFLSALSQRKLVSPDVSDSMLLLLARQPNNDRIPAELPDGVLVAHKTGELPGVRNDVGIVFAPSGRYVICVFGEGDAGTEGDMMAVIAHVSRLVYDRYAQAPSPNQGSVAQPTPR